ncbi:MAG: PAS domain-containing protein [Legionellales bacterium]|nr:PAS domain-containing protein [Legionellales bacterium]
MTHETTVLQGLIDSDDVAVFLKDEQGRFVMVNHAVEKLFNRQESEILGKTDYDFSPKKLADEYRKNDLQVTKQKTSSTFIEEVETSHGFRKYLSYKFPVKNGNGVTNAVGGIAINITEKN